ncbi:MULTISPECIES: hypothetical protein [Chelativorans]|jgi:hypothetical protein|uniref:Uncharacterized protein n=1 Tax=Chelativorans sp. (strain BNC1) TaxID=266779 RepID=Q11LA4_CHESB|nr:MULTISPECIES: hypothetical protein [Chelativorans]
MGPDVMLARASRARELATSTFSRQEIPPPSCGLSSDREKGHDLDDLSHAFLCLGGDIAQLSNCSDAIFSLLADRYPGTKPDKITLFTI